MTSALHYHLVTPERLFASGEAEMVVVPGVLGDFGVMRDHVPFVSLVKPGVIEIHRDGAVAERVFIAGGYAETHGDQCSILAETLERVADMDVAKLRQERDDARHALTHAADDLAKARAETTLALAEARLEAVV